MEIPFEAQVNRAIMQVPWNLIPAQVGNCERIPDALLGLMKPNPSARQKHCWNIDNFVVVQGGLYEGAFYVVPFLIAMLRMEAACKVEILELLFEISNATSQKNDFVHYGIKTDPFVYYMPKASGEICENLSVACRSAVLKGLPLYVLELEGKSPEHKEKALELLSSFTEHPFIIRSILLSAAEKEEDAGFKKRIAEARRDFRK